MLGSVVQLLFDPYPLRTLLSLVCRKLHVGTYNWRIKHDAIERAHYGYCLFTAAKLAVALGKPRISAIEFGVAGGNGLVNLEYHARQIEEVLPITIEIYGFDAGTGLPPPKDYRDLPYVWKQGFFEMDVKKLKQRLSRAKLVLGDVAETVKTFSSDYNPAPLGFISFDLDYYSSTVEAMTILSHIATSLPRIQCYFDDILGGDGVMYSDRTGERLAIEEFNRSCLNQHLSLAYDLQGYKVSMPWHKQVFVLHQFDHPEYCTFVHSENQQLKLK